MILYTMMPQELVYPTSPEEYGKQVEMTINGIPMIVEKSEQSLRIVRVLSTDPMHFLDSRYVPGMTINLV